MSFDMSSNAKLYIIMQILSVLGIVGRDCLVQIVLNTFVLGRCEFELAEGCDSM